MSRAAATSPLLNAIRLVRVAGFNWPWGIKGIAGGWNDGDGALMAGGEPETPPRKRNPDLRGQDSGET